MFKLGIIMDPITEINIKKDSSFAMILEMQRRQYDIFYIEINQLYLSNGEAYAYAKKIVQIQEHSKKWCKLQQGKNIPLKKLNAILMRKNPPFNLKYIYSTYILEIAETTGTLIVNKPQSLRDCNEKIFINWFKNIIPTTLVSNNKKRIKEFYKKNIDIILKPLNKMAGESIFRIKKNDSNINVIIETLTKNNKRFCMAQKYLPEIKNGDKRILVINGKPIPYCLVRIPKKNETRANLSKGAISIAKPLTKNDWKISNIISPILKKKGLIFVGLDIIGNKLTEINVTSPTGIREIEKAFPQLSITNILFNKIEEKIKKINNKKPTKTFKLKKP